MTQQDFDALKRDADGYLRVPSGDWTQVNSQGLDKIFFSDRCRLGDNCKLGDWCRLGNDCKLGDRCRLGDNCKLGDRCQLGDECQLDSGCRLGDWCRLGNDCKLGGGCKLGSGCQLGDWCRLGNDCKLGRECQLGDECKLGRECQLGDECQLSGKTDMEGGRVRNAAYFFVSNIGSGNRTAYAYCNTVTGERFYRAGCWFSDEAAFIERVKSVHGGTRHEKDYLALVAFAQARFSNTEV